ARCSVARFPKRAPTLACAPRRKRGFLDHASRIVLCGPLPRKQSDQTVYRHHHSVLSGTSETPTLGDHVAYNGIVVTPLCLGLTEPLSGLKLATVVLTLDSHPPSSESR